MANIITASRILAVFAMVFAEVPSPAFWVLYAWCGLSDMVDGSIARKLGRQSDFGAKLDSAADTAFAVACLLKILPVFQLPAWLIVWIAAIALCKATAYISGLVKHGKLIALHTIANKAAGLLVFASVPAILLTGTALASIPACAVATFAAVQEGHLIRTNQLDGLS